MVYLAILLILCGLLILITALSVETGRITAAGDIISRGAVKPADYNSADSGSEEIDTIFPCELTDEINTGMDEDDIFISFEDEKDELSDFEDFSDGDIPIAESVMDRSFRSDGEVYPEERRRPASDEMFEVMENESDFSSPRIDDNRAVSAIMFDDRSNIIDYESGVGAIDSTFSKYKSIKRIGKGIIESDFDGVNFYLDEKLYRFDFHKVYDIWSGPDYIALPLKGNSTVKLFLIQNSPGFPDKVEADFKEYEKGL